MKKATEWYTKQMKREKKKKDRGIVDLMMILNHFFRDLNQWIEEMKDPRNGSYTVYTQSDYFFMGILKNVCSVESMRQMEERFNEDACIDTLRILSGNQELKEMPNYGSLNAYLERLSPKDLSGLRRKMVKTLLRGKQFYRGRLLGKYWRVILDGTGLYSFQERHCENCLCSTYKDENGKKRKYYYHKVLEAKLILGDGLVISLGTEFIENEKEDVEKQDCEINAAKRLLGRLKEEYPRLPVCIQGDALYAVEPMMGLCRKNHWSYIFTQKETRQKVVGRDYKDLEAEDLNEVKSISREEGSGRFYNGIGEISGKKEAINIFEYSYEQETRDGVTQNCFQWITDLEVTKRNLEELVEAGRGRWKIENEGFNNQKNGIYRIEHLNSRNRTAMKNHYLLTQIADLIMQLYLAWSPLVREIQQSIKSTSSRLLESFRRQTVTEEDVLYTKRYTCIYLE